MEGTGITEPMVSKLEFSRAYLVCRRWTTAFGLGLTILWWGGVVSIFGRFRFEATTSGAAWFAVFILVVLVMYLTVLLWATRLIRKKHGMTCAACGDWIYWPELVLKTGTCPKCKAEIFRNT